MAKKRQTKDVEALLEEVHEEAIKEVAEASRLTSVTIRDVDGFRKAFENYEAALDDEDTACRETLRMRGEVSRCQDKESKARHKAKEKREILREFLGDAITPKRAYNDDEQED